MNRLRNVLAVSAAAGLAVLAAGCSASSASSPAAAAPAAAAQPDTAAAASAAAQEFFALYSAGQWDAAWQYLTPADKKQVPESAYAALHGGCPSAETGMAYSISGVTLAGTTAVVTYTIPALAKAFGSATMPMTWTPAGWGVQLSGSSLAEYSHGNAAADIAAAKKAGECSGN